MSSKKQDTQDIINLILIVKIPQYRKFLQFTKNGLVNIEKTLKNIKTKDLFYSNTPLEEEATKIYQQSFDNELSEIITINSPKYPERLRAIRDAPLVLYCKGNTALLLEENIIAVVGSRKATHESLKLSHDFSRELMESGMTICSGFAMGVDSLSCQGGKEKTIQVLGGGVDRIYPKQNTQLYYEVLESNGLFVSEFEWNAEPKSQNFPKRNRTISGLSKAILLVQSALQSGSLITARYALEQNKTVFAIPSHPANLSFAGNNSLIKNGDAVFTTSCDDIKEEVLISYNSDLLQYNKHSTQSDKPKKSKSNNTEEKYSATEREQVILQLISKSPITIDELSAISKINIQEIQVVVSNLEIKGEIEKNIHNQFYKISP